MNPLTNVRNIQNLNKRELDLGIPFSQSWHQQYKESAWIFIGGLDYDLTEGDIICVFSQYGEVVNINLIRDQKTGKSKGFAFLCYEDQRSTVLSVDNLNSIKLCGRTIRVDHVEEYKVPKMKEDMAPEKIKLALEGCAPQLQPPSQAGGLAVAVDRNPKPPSLKREKHGGYNDRNVRPSSGHISDVKTEPAQSSDDIALPPRLFNVGVKEIGAAVQKKKKDKKKKSKKSKKKSKSKKSKKDKGSDSSSSSSDSEDGSESDRGHKYSGRDNSTKRKRPEGGRNQIGESSSNHERRTDLYSPHHRDIVTVKKEPLDSRSSSKREGLAGVNEHRGSSVCDWRSRVKEEPRSDGSDGDSGVRERSRARGRQLNDGGTVSQSRYKGSRNDGEDDYSGVNGDRKGSREGEENRRKCDDRYDNNTDNYRRSAISDRDYANTSRDADSNRKYVRDYDKVRR